MTKPLGFTTEQTAPNVITVRMKPVSGWTQRFLLSADRHHDNPHTDQALERRHLEEVLTSGAGIIDLGDLFCAMQGKFDKRSSKNDLRPEHKSGDYLDSLVRTAANFFEPYAKNWVCMMPGNHETAILKNHETFLTERLIERIQERTKHRIPKGGFTTWIRFIFCEKGETSFNPSTVTMFCHHGYGGGGPVTRGVIQTNRMAVYLPDAQIVATGHTHDEFQVPISRARLSVRGVPYQDEQLHLKIPSYKDEYANGEGGWHIERGGPPKPIGALWLTFSMRNKQIFTEVTRAR